MARSTAGPGDSTELSLSIPYAVRVPSAQEAYIVTATDWRRIKEAIKAIRSQDSYWFTAMLSCFAIAVSILGGLLALNQQTGVASVLRASFIAITSASFAAGLVCGVAYLQSRRYRIDDVAVPIRYMEDIEKLNQGPEEQ